MDRDLKFRIEEVEELLCLCSENKGADQLRGSDREANHRLYSGICKKQVFSRGSIIDKLIIEYYCTLRKFKCTQMR